MSISIFLQMPSCRYNLVLEQASFLANLYPVYKKVIAYSISVKPKTASGSSVVNGIDFQKN